MMCAEWASRHRLLVIDDDPDFGRFVAEAGRLSGYDARVTDSPQVFLADLDRWAPHVVVVDLHMPDMDGVEIMREMARRGSQARVVLASGIDARTIGTTRLLGDQVGLRMADVFEKPASLADLRALFEGLKEAVDPINSQSLGRAIDEQGLFLLFQPKIHLETGAVAGLEALVRWRTADGVVGPDAFIPIAEADRDLADSLTRWVVREAMSVGKGWCEAWPDLRIAVNVSATNIHDRTLPDSLQKLCCAQGVHPSRLTLELTETASMQDVATLMEVSSRFRIKGFQLSIDDFGTGYSSLAQLVRLPFSEIKIDKSFVTGMGRDRESLIVARSVVDLGRNLGLSVVAEGVESAKVADMLREIGCTFAQGYHYARPLPADQVGEYISQRTAESAKAADILNRA